MSMSLHSYQKKPTSTFEDQQFELVEKSLSEDGTMILQPITMSIPNSCGVYSPSKLRSKKEISCEEFLTQYAHYSREIRVCFVENITPETLLQKSEFVTAYGFGLNCWYIVTSNSLENKLLKVEQELS
jgi:hypothetical protein